MVSLSAQLKFVCLITVLFLGFPETTQGCNRVRTGRTTPLPSLSKKDLPNLQWPHTDILSKQVLDIQLKALNDYNEQVAKWKTAISIGSRIIRYNKITFPLKIIDNLLLTMVSTKELENKMVDFKIDTALFRFGLQQINHELTLMGKNLEASNNVNHEIETRRFQIHSAFESLQRIVVILKDQSNPLAQFKTLTFPFVTAFVTLAGIVGGYTTVFLQDLEEDVSGYYKDLRDVLKMYGTEAWINRVNYVQRVRNTTCKYIGHAEGSPGSHCNLFPRSDSNTIDPSGCYLPNEAESLDVNEIQNGPFGATEQCWYDLAVVDLAIDRVLCYHSPKIDCYSSYISKLKEEFHTMVDLALAAVQNPTQWKTNSSSSPMFVPTTSIGSPAPLDETCSLNYILSSSVPKYFGDQGKAYALQAMGAFIIDAPRNYSDDNYVCRASHSGNIYPGKSNGQYCWFSFQGQESGLEGLEILAHTWAWRESKKLIWKTRSEVSGNSTSVVVVGQNQDGPLYVGRCSVGNLLVTGYMSGGVTYVTYDSRIRNCQNPSDLVLVCE